MAEDTDITKPEDVSASGPQASVVDEVLSVEDPAFVAAMTELKEQAVQADLADAQPVEIDSLDLAALEPVAAPTFKSRIFSIVARLKEAIAYGLGFVKSGLSWFKSLPTKSKLLLVAAIILGSVSAVALRLAFTSQFMPSLQLPFLNSFADVAQAHYEYDEKEKLRDFADPLSHPEFVVLLKRVVVNLRSPGDGSNPMALFELYLEASNEASAVEIKDRETEIRDMMLRTMERLTFSELSEIAGKEKMKALLRRNLNAILTKGQIRRVYIKTAVLKD